MLVPRTDDRPLPRWLSSAIGRYAGRERLWDFPCPTVMSQGVLFAPLDFPLQDRVLRAFYDDEDRWVDPRFKDPRLLREHITALQLCLPHSPQHGGCDWVVTLPDGRCAGVLHMLGFSVAGAARERAACSVGFAFAREQRGSGLPAAAMRHFHAYLFETLQRERVLAQVSKRNVRCQRFLAKLGYREVEEDGAFRPRRGALCLELCRP